MQALIDLFESYSPAVCIIRILFAAICGGIIGVERTLRQKDAGFRTHIIVAMGAALMMIISKYGFFDVITIDGISSDAGRIAANIITGISFLGAGMIFVKGFSIKGLTTAAGVWVTAAVGMAIGAGLYTIGFFSVLILLLVQIIFHRFLIGLDKVLANDTVTPCFIQISNKTDAVDFLRKHLSENSVIVSDFSVEPSIDNQVLTIRLNVQFSKKVNINQVLDNLNTFPDVKQAFTL